MLFIHVQLPVLNHSVPSHKISIIKPFRYNLQSASSKTITRATLSQPSSSKSSQDPCPVCSDTTTLPCTLCNAQGFLKVNQNTVWRTCHICIGRGKIICKHCQGPDAKLPPEFTH